MKKILLFICLIVSVDMVSQNIPGYNTRTVREKLIAISVDSGLHVPRYNGAPSGLRVGVYVADGQIAMDTTNHRLYIYSGGSWLRLAKFTELASGSRFGVEDNMAGQNRTFTGRDNTYGVYLDSLNEFRVARNGVTRMYMDNTQTLHQSPNGTTLLNIQNGLTQLSINSAANYLWGRADSFLLHKKISYEGNIHSTFFPYSLVDKSYVDSVVAAGGGVPTIQQVLTSGNTVTDQDLHFGDGGYISWDFANDGFSLNQYNTGNNMFFEYPGFPAVTKFNFANSGTNIFEWPSTGRATDTVATLFDVRAGGGGGTPTWQQVLSAGSTLTGDNVITVGNNDFEWQGIKNYTATVGTAYLLNANGTYDIVRSGTDRFKINSSTTSLWSPNGSNVVDMQNSELYLDFPAYTVVGLPSGSATDSVMVWNPSTERWGVRDAATIGGGSGVTSVSFTDGNGFNGTVTNPTTTPAISLAIDNPSFQQWYQYYMGSTTAYTGPFTSGFAGAGGSVSAFNIAATLIDGWMGGMAFNTGTTTTGQAYNYGDVSGNFVAVVINNSFRYNIGAKLRFEDLSDGTDTYTHLFGFVDELLGLNPTDGIYVTYTHSASSGQFVFHTESNSTVTSTATGVTVAADTDYEVEISVYNGNAYCYINKTLVATHTTNIPTGTARVTSMGQIISKSAGTNARKVYIEWMAYGKRNN